MTDAKDLAARLRNAALPGTNRHALDSLAADLIEQQAAEIERLRAGLRAAKWFMQMPKRMKLSRDYSPLTNDMFAALDAAMKGTP